MIYHVPLPSHLLPHRLHALQELLYFGHSLTFWVNSQLGDAAAPQSGMMEFAVRVPPHLVYGKVSRSSRRLCLMLYLQLLLCPGEAVPLGTHLCPSLAAEEGQLSSWMSQLSEAWRQNSLVVSEQEHLRCLRQEGFCSLWSEEATTGFGRLLGINNSCPKITVCYQGQGL